AAVGPKLRTADLQSARTALRQWRHGSDRRAGTDGGKRMKAFSIGVAAALALAAAAQAEPVKLRTASGVVVGASEGGVNTFKGVPFAKPPVGPLRWQPPQPVSWTGERDATKFALPCPQPINANGTANGGGVSGATSEDCLYLNVWAPK